MRPAKGLRPGLAIPKLCAARHHHRRRPWRMRHSNGGADPRIAKIAAECKPVTKASGDRHRRGLSLSPCRHAVGALAARRLVVPLICLGIEAGVHLEPGASRPGRRPTASWPIPRPACSARRNLLVIGNLPLPVVSDVSALPARHEGRSPPAAPHWPEASLLPFLHVACSPHRRSSGRSSAPAAASSREPGDRRPVLGPRPSLEA
jgi:hypothetical protein